MASEPMSSLPVPIELLAAVRELAGDSLREEYRARVEFASTLHDQIAQTLAAARMKLALMAHGLPPDKTADHAFVMRCLDEALDGVRALTRRVAPPPLRELGLLPSLRWLARDIEQRRDIAVLLELPASADLEHQPGATQSTRAALFHALDGIAERIAEADGDRMIVAIEGYGDPMRLSIPLPVDVNLDGVRERAGWSGVGVEIVGNGGGPRVVLSVPRLPGA